MREGELLRHKTAREQCQNGELNRKLDMAHALSCDANHSFTGGPTSPAQSSWPRSGDPKVEEATSVDEPTNDSQIVALLLWLVGVGRSPGPLTQ